MTVSDSGSTPMFFGGDGMGFGGGGFIWAFLIFALLMGNGGFGNWGNGNGNANALEASMNRGFDNQNSMANQREILSAVTNGTSQSVAATNQTFHDMLAYTGDKYNELTRDIGALSVAQANALANQNQCCCEQKMLTAETSAAINANIAQARYEAAMNMAASNANNTALSQKILDKLSESENKALQNRVNQLELAQALCGVPRYQPNYTYGMVQTPFVGGFVPQPFVA